MNLHQSFKKCSILTPGIRKQPQTPKNQFKKQIKVQQWPLDGARWSYVHNSYGNIFKGIPKMLVLCNFLKILMVWGKMIHRAFSSQLLIQLYKQNPLQKFFIFHYLPKLYIGFNMKI